jgi:hypothetical protein
VVIDTLIHSISKLFTSCIASQDRIIAITHPIAVTTTDSIKNCVIISLFNAQIAFLIQISLVLSVTETSIIFITPIHPTSKEIEPIAANKYVKMDIASSIASHIADNEETENPAKSICEILYFLIRKYFILFCRSFTSSSYPKITVMLEILDDELIFC